MQLRTATVTTVRLLLESQLDSHRSRKQSFKEVQQIQTGETESVQQIIAAKVALTDSIAPPGHSKRRDHQKPGRSSVFQSVLKFGLRFKVAKLTDLRLIFYQLIIKYYIEQPGNGRICGFGRFDSTSELQFRVLGCLSAWLHTHVAYFRMPGRNRFDLSTNVAIEVQRFPFKVRVTHASA